MILLRRSCKALILQQRHQHWQQQQQRWQSELLKQYRLPSDAFMVGKGDFPIGSREYCLVRKINFIPDKNKMEQYEGKKFVNHSGVPCEVLGSVKANVNTVFNAWCTKGMTVQRACAPLLHRAVEDCGADGAQPRAMAALYGLCDYVKECLDEGNKKIKSPVLEKMRAEHDDKMLEAVKAIATGIPRPGHAVVGQATHRDAATGWEALAKEYGRSGRCDECQLYLNHGAELVAIELLADTKPDYLASAGGAMAGFFFVEDQEEQEEEEDVPPFAPPIREQADPDAYKK